MSLHFYCVGEDNEKEESIDNHKDLFTEYIDKPPSLKEALNQIFISGGVPDNKVDDYIYDITKKVTKLVEDRQSKIKAKYPNITYEDSLIICSYTREAINSEYSPYKILNRNLASDNREEGLKKVSKYLYILLKALRKLKLYYPSEEQKYLYRGITFKIETKIDPYNPKFVPYLRNKKKTFWAFTSTSPLTSTAFGFLKDNGYYKEKKLKSGTFFSLYGKISGYDISLFNSYNEEEILLEPERKFRIENVIPDYSSGIINVTCEILDSPNVLSDLKKIAYFKAKVFARFMKNKYVEEIMEPPKQEYKPIGSLNEYKYNNYKPDKMFMKNNYLDEIMEPPKLEFKLVGHIIKGIYLEDISELLTRILSQIEILAGLCESKSQYDYKKYYLEKSPLEIFNSLKSDIDIFEKMCLKYWNDGYVLSFENSEKKFLLNLKYSNIGNKAGYKKFGVLLDRVYDQVFFDDIS